MKNHYIDASISKNLYRTACGRKIKKPKNDEEIYARSALSKCWTCQKLRKWK